MPGCQATAIDQSAGMAGLVDVDMVLASVEKPEAERTSGRASGPGKGEGDRGIVQALSVLGLPSHGGGRAAGFGSAGVQRSTGLSHHARARPTSTASATRCGHEGSNALVRHVAEGTERAVANGRHVHSLAWSNLVVCGDRDGLLLTIFARLSRMLASNGAKRRGGFERSGGGSGTPSWSAAACAATGHRQWFGVHVQGVQNATRRQFSTCAHPISHAGTAWSAGTIPQDIQVRRGLSTGLCKPGALPRVHRGLSSVVQRKTTALGAASGTGCRPNHTHGRLRAWRGSGTSQMAGVGASERKNGQGNGSEPRLSCTARRRNQRMKPTDFSILKIPAIYDVKTNRTSMKIAENTRLVTIKNCS